MMRLLSALPIVLRAVAVAWQGGRSSRRHATHPASLPATMATAMLIPCCLKHLPNGARIFSLAGALSQFATCSRRDKGARGLTRPSAPRRLRCTIPAKAGRSPMRRFPFNHRVLHIPRHAVCRMHQPELCDTAINLPLP